MSAFGELSPKNTNKRFQQPTFQVDAQRKSSIQSIADQLRGGLKKKNPVIFMRESPQSQLIQLKRNKNLSVQQEQIEYDREKQELLESVNQFEKLDKAQPIDNSLVELERKRQQKEANEFAAQKIQKMIQETQLLKKSVSLDSRKEIKKAQTEDENLKSGETSPFRMASRRTSQINEKIPLQPETNQFEEVQVPSPKKIVDFDSKDFQYLKQSKKKQLKVVEQELSEVKQKENRPFIRLTGALKEKWGRVSRKIRMIGSMKLVFDEVKLYGTSFRVETSEQRKEVIGELESILQKRIAIMDINNKQKFSRLGYLFHPQGRLKQFWQIVLVFLLVYTAFVTPIEITFIDEITLTWQILDNLMNCILGLDILISFNSAYYDETDELIISRKKITIKYLRTWFILDLLSIFPFDNLFPQNDPNSQQQVVSIKDYFKLTRLPRLYKLIRISRLLKLVKRAKHDKYGEKLEDYFGLTAGKRRILIFFMTVIVFAHIMGCFWYYAAKLQNFGPNTWVYELGYQNASNYQLYVISIYWTMTTLSTCGFGDIHAFNDFFFFYIIILSRNLVERILSILWMIFGAGFYSFTVSSLSNIVGSYSTRKSQLHYRITITDEFCKETNLSQSLRDQIRQALVYSSQKQVFTKNQRDEFLKEIPLNLKYSVADSMYQGLRNKVVFFKNKEESFIANFVTILTPMRVSTGDLIYQKGEHPSLVYFIVSGRVNMVIGMHQITFKTYVSGSYFGEFEVFDSSARLHTSRAQVTCDLLTIPQKEFLHILKQYPDYYLEVKETSYQRLKQENHSIKNIHKIANLSYKSKFWQKQRMTNLYVSVKERQLPQLVEEESDESSQSLVSSISSKSIKEQRYRKRVAHQISSLVPMNYKHSLVPNDDSTPKINKKEKILFSQSFNIPEYFKDETGMSYMNIKVTQFQDDQMNSTPGTPIRLRKNEQDDELFEDSPPYPQSQDFKSICPALLKPPEIDRKVRETIQDTEQLVKEMDKVAQQLNEEDNQKNDGKKSEEQRLELLILENEKKIQDLNQNYEVLIKRLEKIVMKKQLHKFSDVSIQTDMPVPKQMLHFQFKNPKLERIHSMHDDERQNIFENHTSSSEDSLDLQ